MSRKKKKAYNHAKIMANKKKNKKWHRKWGQKICCACFFLDSALVFSNKYWKSTSQTEFKCIKNTLIIGKMEKNIN